MIEMDAVDFESLVTDELDLLPDEMIDGLDNVVFVVEDRPEDGSLDLLVNCAWGGYEKLLVSAAPPRQHDLRQSSSAPRTAASRRSISNCLSRFPTVGGPAAAAGNWGPNPRRSRGGLTYFGDGRLLRMHNADKHAQVGIV